MSRKDEPDAVGPTVAAPDALESGRTLAQGSQPSGTDDTGISGGGTPAAPGTPGPVIRAGRRAGSPTGDQDWKPGTHIGRYVVLARIGAGGMGAVYRAEDVELGRAVALKRLHAGASEDSRARLVREARTAAQLQHANVLTVHEVGEHEGIAFLAMELVDGVTLTQWLKQSYRSWRETLAMLCQAGHGLVAAHERGLVHRDFKPDNVLVDRSGRARVADFGLARSGDDVHETGGRIAAGDARLARLTETGAIAGTPAYMAPELVDGKPPDARSDQYAFAVTLHEALHGQHPFEGATAEALWNAMADERIRPGTRRLPASVQLYIRRGLAADPTKRWPDVASFVRALETAATSRRRSWLWASGAAALIAAGASAAVVLRGRAAQQPCQEVVRAYRINYEHDTLTRAVPDPADLARVEAAIASFQDEAKTQLIESCMDTRAGRQTRQLAEKRATCINRARNRVWSVFDRITETAQSSAAIAAALDDMPDLGHCANLEVMSRRTLPPLTNADRDSLTRAEADLQRAVSLRDQGDLVGAESALDAAEKVAARLDERSITTRAWIMRSEIARDRGDISAARQAATQAVAEAGLGGDSKLALEAEVVMLAAQADARTADSFAGLKESDDSLDSATLRIAHGDSLTAAGRFAEGEAEYRRALAIREKLLPPAHVDRALALQRVGASLIIQKKVAEARPVLEQATTAVSKALPPLRREAIDGVRYLAMVEEEAGNLPRALELRRDVLERRTKVLGAKHLMVLDARADVGRALSDLGDFEHAVVELGAVVDGMTAAMGEMSYNAADARVSLANALVSSGQFADADKELAAAIPVISRGKGADSPYTLVAEYGQVRSWVERPKPVKLPEATQALDRIEPVFVKLFGESSAPAAAIAMSRARVALAKGNAKLADELATRGTTLLVDKPGDRAEGFAVHAAILWKLGNKQAARAAAERAIHDFEAAGAGHARSVVAVRNWLAHPSAQPPLPVLTK